MSVIPPKEKDDIDTKFDHSQIYLYELNAHKQPLARPRHCMPYAVLTWLKFNDGTEWPQYFENDADVSILTSDSLQLALKTTEDIYLQTKLKTLLKTTRHDCQNGVNNGDSNGAHTIFNGVVNGSNGTAETNGSNGASEAINGTNGTNGVEVKNESVDVQTSESIESTEDIKTEVTQQPETNGLANSDSSPTPEAVKEADKTEEESQANEEPKLPISNDPTPSLEKTDNSEAIIKPSEGSETIEQDKYGNFVY